MQIRSYILLVALCICFVTKSHSQPRNYEIRNGIMLGGGLTQYDITSENFETKPGNGWFISAGLSGDLPHKWFNISYSMQLSENKVEFSGRMTDDVAGEEAVEYKLFAVQAGLVFHIKLIQSFFTLDLGPQLQYNSGLELTDDTQESYFLNGYDALGVMDITEISNFNINGMAGLTAGYGAFKLRAQYIYGVLNSFEKLNGQNLNTDGTTQFKGNQSMFTFGAFITF
ncbi:MAG: hypothetical protein KJP20_06160 [Bacteroidia bacterium]|nr:hypothetical protein [Bacteroidia bacterium]NNL32282.1 hypothetical protein [Flavobacteriaceae bacterium]RZW49479.1 MAG: hypothetical protein EX263_07935 [Flavobacteriaceae bacterium]